jgi:AcrR family transcriptional regulator
MLDHGDVAYEQKLNSYHHGDLRRSLIDVGVELLKEKGEGALSLREVARCAGVTHTAPYRHFSDKDALLEAIAMQGFELLQTNLDSVASGNIGPRQRLEALLQAYIHFAHENPHHARVMFGSVAKTNLQELKVLASATFRILVKAISDLQATDPNKNTVHAESLALLLWSQAHGLMVLSENVDFSELDPSVPASQSLSKCLSVTLDALFVTNQSGKPHQK